MYGGSAAEKAGIQAGDVIVEVDGKPVRSAAELTELVARHRPGDQIRIVYYRGAERRETVARLKGYSSEEKALNESSEATLLRSLGALVRPISKAEKNQLGVSHGLKVVQVEPGPLREAGVRPGFVITSLDRKPVRTPEEAQKLLKNIQGALLIEGLYQKGEKATMPSP